MAVSAMIDAYSKDGQVGISPPLDRAEFLHGIYQLGAADLAALSFDGNAFRLKNTTVDYRDVHSLRADPAQWTAVSNPAIPHVTRWQHRRIDGGPDLRYRGNTKSMTALQIPVLLTGKCEKKMHIYVSSEASARTCQAIIARFNDFLSTAEAVGIDDYWGPFRTAHEQCKHSERAHRRLVERRAEVRIVMAAASRRGTANSPSAPAAEAMAAAEVEDLGNRIAELEQLGKDARRTMEKAILEARSKVQHVLDSRKIDNYVNARPSKNTTSAPGS